MKTSSLPAELKARAIKVITAYTEAGNNLTELAPSFGEWAAYVLQGPSIPDYMAKSQVPIPADKLPAVQEVWRTYDEYSNLMQEYQALGYDYAVHLMPLADQIARNLSVC